LMQLKNDDFRASKSVIVTSEEQREYFKVVIKAAELVLPGLTGVTKNISTGTVRLSSGKMSSRTGDVLNIEWLFEQLRAALRERGGDETDRDTIIGALRYSMLRPRVGGDVIFDVEQSLSIEGNSGPYLQYAHARARSIIRKSVESVAEPSELDVSERTLLVKISEYPEVLELAAQELLPHHICTYLYGLSQEFNRFYEQSKVVGDPREKQRLFLVEAYADTLARGLEVLGIPAPERL
jgi:arginyl-tRNA synthetase